MNNSKLCRICCQNQGTIFIFNEDMKVRSRLQYVCGNLVINEDDRLPNHICVECEVELAVSYKFVLKCEDSERRLRAPLKEETPDFLGDDALADHDDVPDVKTEVEEPVKSHKQPNKKATKQTKSICPLCGISCKSRVKLSSHLRSHSEYKPHACSICDKRYKDSGTLKRHVERNHDEERSRKFVCEQCGKRFFSKQEIKVHMRIHTGETPYVCTICSMKFVQQSSCARHQRTHTGERRFMCTVCSKMFGSKDNLKTHLNVHSTEKKYSCHICNSLFKYKANLTKHIKSHSEHNGFVCNYCGQSFTTKGNLKIHIDRQHSENSGDCSVCAKSVPNLEVHMRKHTGERPLKCEHCSSTFFEQNGLAHHINFRHKNTDKYKCSVESCFESFPSQPMLDFHTAKRHSCHVPFHCDQCSRGFYRKNDLARHKIGTHKQRLIL